MSLVNLTKVASVAKTATQPEIGYTKDGGVEAFRIFFDSGTPSFKIIAQKSAYPGRKGNFLRVGIVHSEDVRYIITLFEGDGDKLDGNLSTQALDEKVTSAGIVEKINSTGAMNVFIKAELINSLSNVDYTGATAINFADAIPIFRGRSRGR